MTTETIDLICKHGSVRHYKPDPVAPDMVENIVAAGQRASTSSNLQMYSVVVVMDDQRRDKMAFLCGNQAFIREAPVFLAWCADLSRLDRVARKRGYQAISNYAENFLLSVVDVSLAMQNAALAAESIGLGICYIGAIRNNPQEVIDLLQLPKLVFPVAGMTVGWPARAPRIRPRLALQAVLNWETYNTENEDAYLDIYDQEMIATGIYKGRQVKTGNQKDVEIYGWTEHSARRVSKAHRTGLKNVLLKQGFSID